MIWLGQSGGSGLTGTHGGSVEGSCLLNDGGELVLRQKEAENRDASPPFPCIRLIFPIRILSCQNRSCKSRSVDLRSQIGVVNPQYRGFSRFLDLYVFRYWIFICNTRMRSREFCCRNITELDFDVKPFMYWPMFSKWMKSRKLSNSLEGFFLRLRLGKWEKGPEAIEKNDVKIEKVLKEAAMENKTVILTTLNVAWASPGSIIDLFFQSFRTGDGTRRLLDHLVIIALDKKAYIRCISLHTHCFALYTKGMDFSDEKIYMTAGYLSMMWRRIEFLRVILEMGYNFIFSFTNLKYSRVEIDEVRFKWAECMLDYI
ncbi:hypothetical protein ZIOFF_047531 [Zingiber officinale]|uniref:Nucleotide-diphospho-sugar transferase domain-containing protein n=1 Tax=Zingiber officinale TaxID=94328 RepID=A0A8J5FN53_ZINOF|nr:hypothetical protein ZIOFF_047531 [Zingiber officinale]